MTAKESKEALTRARPRYHDPTTQLGGTRALSPLTLRLRLATWGLVMSLIGVVVSTAVTEEAAIAIAFGLVAATALVDVLVIQRRRHQGEAG